MSYRTFKRVLGETSLERKCRFLFGASLLLLILTTFLLVDHEATKIIQDKPRGNGRHLAGSVLRALHSERLASSVERPRIHEMNYDLEDLLYSWSIVSLEEIDPSLKPYMSTPTDKKGRQMLEEMRRLAQQRFAPEEVVPPGDDSAEREDDALVAENKQVFETYKDKPPVVDIRRRDALNEFRFYQAVHWRESCLDCHKTLHSEYLGDLATDPDTTPAELLAHMPFRVVRVDFQNQPTKRYLNKLRAFLIAMGIVTIFLSMVALYIVVRYVIVKPLQHLQEISEQVEQGDYEARAQIETNDEFESLAGSFNRMVRHLVDTQGELQHANTKLDLKVDELAQVNMQLFELNCMKSEFLANVSHELRTPLNSIIGFADVLKNIETLVPKQRRYAENIGNSGKVLLEMINDILDLAKMESGKMLVRPSEFSVASVAQAQIDVVHGLAAEKNIDISFECRSGLPDVYQDQAKVQQILTNLLSNAIKFTPDGGRISVRVTPLYEEDMTTPAKLRMTVEDTGIGIAEEDHEIIFEKFRQATPVKGSDSLTREFSGTGLGLSIIRELCTLLSGEVTFESQLGHGSAFTVMLPWSLKVSAASLDTGKPDALAIGLAPGGLVTSRDQPPDATGRTESIS